MIEKIKQILRAKEYLRGQLFVRGFLITNDKKINPVDYPFYGAWKTIEIERYKFFIHAKQNCTLYNCKGYEFFLVGHCVNPYTGEFQEETIIKNLSNKYFENKEIFFEYINSLTGNFILGYVQDEKIWFLNDPCGMLFCCYGEINGNVYISSHAQLLGDLLKLSKTEYVQKLEKYKYFYKYGLFFAGDLTQYSELKRVMQNHYYVYEGEWRHSRFYPNKEICEVENNEEYRKIVEETVDVLHKTLELVSLKWKDRLAISLTGGMDSKTTLSCAKGIYDRFKYYSYISMEGDRQDALAANKIAKSLGLKHIIYQISENDSDFEDFEEYKTIIEHNNGDYKINANDIRKRLFLKNCSDFDVEIKSWVSEVARANYYKKFGLAKMPSKLNSRHMTAMYKVFTTQRKLAKQTDKVFERFIEDSQFNSIPKGYDASDMYLWEFRYSAWGGMVITSEHSFSNLIFIPYNNRRLLTTMLQSPLKERISDKFHDSLIQRGDKRIFDEGITITNWNETKKRMLIEKMYFLLSSFFKIF